MRESPSIVLSNDQDVYLVLDDYGEWGTAWRETDVEDTDLESVITDLVEGQYINPVRVVGFNVSQGWVRDVSTDVARELMQRCANQDRRVPDFLEEFVASDNRSSFWLPSMREMGVRGLLHNRQRHRRSVQRPASSLAKLHRRKPCPH
jgi:hypothetical protein